MDNVQGCVLVNAFTPPPSGNPVSAPEHHTLNTVHLYIYTVTMYMNTVLINVANNMCK